MDTTHGATCQPTMPMPPLKSPQSPPYLMAFFAAQDSVAKDGGTVSCDPSKITDATKLAACQTYVSFSNYCRLAGGLISAGMSTGYALLEKKGDDKDANIVWDSCSAFYNLLCGVNDELLKAIDDANAAQPFEPIEGSSKMPPLPKKPGGDSGGAAATIIQGVWEAISARLQQVLDHCKGGNTTLKIAISGLLKNGQAAFDDLKPILDMLLGDKTTA